MDLERLDERLETANRALLVGEFVTAEMEYATILSQDRDHPHATANLAVVMLKTGRTEAALILAKRAAVLQPTNPGVWTNLGYIHGVLGHFSSCAITLRRSLALEPSHFAWHALGLCLYSQGMFSESVKAFDNALEFEPNNADSIDKRSISMLGAARYVDGLKDNRLRWDVLKAHPLMHSKVPEWNGEPIKDKTIMVLHEQGYGDTFQFCRFVPWLKRKLKAAHVIMSVPPSTIELFQHAKLADEIIGLNDVPACGLGKVDFICPMMTLAAHLGVTLSKVKVPPYLFANVDVKSATYKPRLTTNNDLPKVGLVWGGRPQFEPDRWRSMDIKTLFPLFEEPCANYYSLQMEERAQELKTSGATAFVTDLSPKIITWMDTANFIAELDLVLTVDTSVAHLAGAMGKRVAIMIPEGGCWRWLTHNRTDSPWYPTAKLFRQQRQGDWNPVIAAVGDYIRNCK